MRIDSLKITNFRAFEHEYITFESPFTLLLGDNGTGKTALLDALRVSIGAYLSGLQGLRPPAIIEADIRERLVPDNLGGVADPPEKVQYAPVSLVASGQLENGRQVEWERRRKTVTGATTTGNIRAITDYVTAQAEARTLRKAITMPLLAYYPANRAARAKAPDSISRVQKPDPWQRAYDTALNATLDKDAHLRWVANTTYAQLQEQAESPLLRATLDAVAACLEGVQSVFYSVQLDELVVEDDQGMRRRAATLSSGYWTMLLMLLDMAHRCVMLNPHLGASVLRDTPGIVLIDELDVHLHPRWQQRVVADLCRTFPCMQFIATTHSPLVSASLPSSALRHLVTAEIGVCHVHQYQENSQGLSPDQMLVSPYFDLESDRPIETMSHLDSLNARVLDGDTAAAHEYLTILNNGTEQLFASSSGRNRKA